MNSNPIQDPIFKGQYSPAIRALAGDRLPSFTEEEISVVKGSADFYGLNHFSAELVRE